MGALALVDGTWVDLLYPTSDLRWSTRWRIDEPAGDFQASVHVTCPPNLQTDWTLPGKQFRVYSHGLLWGGLTSEPERSASGITLHAQGIGSSLKEWMAIDRDSDPDNQVPTANANLAVDEAAAAGAPFTRAGVDLGSTALGEDEPFTDIGTLLSRVATAAGKLVRVDSQGVITLATPASSPTWTLSSDEEYMGTADDQFVARLFGYFIDESTDLPATVVAEDEDAAELFGIRERGIDLRPLGPMAETTADAYIQGRFALVGGRMGWTEQVQLTPLNLSAINGAAAAARYPRAGDVLQIPGNVDARSQPTVRGAIRFLMSEVEVVDGDFPTATAAPEGLPPRDFEGALERPENPAEKETV